MNEESTAIQKEYDRLTEEIRSRYVHHYHFHYVALVILGAAIAVLSRDIVPTPILEAVFLAGPFIFFPVIVLMLKEHAYMDLREHYIDSVLKPRLHELLGNAPAAAPRNRSLLGWHRWERFATRGTKGRKLLYGFFGFAEYLLPVFLSASSLVGSWVLMHSKWTRVTMVVFAIGVALVLGAILLIAFSRIAMPHLPEGSEPGEGPETEPAQPAAATYVGARTDAPSGPAEA
ncbi:MAG: hypothetical protein KDD47_23780 [Acidobacteria bacterium]|nr:hypothetical protein [Acidobacteriota bacterium]